MHKMLDLEGKQVKAVANALIPRLYRFHFGTDLIMDLQKFQKSYQDDPATVSFAPVENLCWLMLKEGGEDVGETPDEWLASLGTVFGLYELLPTVVEMWASNAATTSKPKKK